MTYNVCHTFHHQMRPTWNNIGILGVKAHIDPWCWGYFGPADSAQLWFFLEGIRIGIATDAPWLNLLGSKLTWAAAAWSCIPCIICLDIAWGNWQMLMDAGRRHWDESLPGCYQDFVHSHFLHSQPSKISGICWHPTCASRASEQYFTICSVAATWPWYTG